MARVIASSLRSGEERLDVSSAAERQIAITRSNVVINEDSQADRTQCSCVCNTTRLLLPSPPPPPALVLLGAWIDTKAP